MTNGFDFSEIDKCDDIFQVRIPTVTKDSLKKLSSKQQAALKEEILLIISKHIHMANYY
jgi:septum formation topological specificity factor MinE